jgi:hypothetical protein
LRAEEEEKKSYPPGTRKMEQEERLKILEELKKTKAQVESDIQKLPISMKTMAIQKKRGDLFA